MAGLRGERPRRRVRPHLTSGLTRGPPRWAHGPESRAHVRIRLALGLALTIRHDGRRGVADDLDTAAGLTAWVRERPDLLGLARAGEGWTADEETLAVRSLRAAVRALFECLRPDVPSPADARSPMPVPEAFDRLNAAADAAPAVPYLEWPDGGRTSPPGHPTGGTPRGDALPATLARAAVGVLAGPDRAALRACRASRASAASSRSTPPGVVHTVLRQSRPGGLPARAAAPHPALPGGAVAW
ncbi:ABATE domain-containing protein [Streptomyces sp. NPDC056352]|uniref:ABATE domain-containing protein n=1 Tax=Streptomyces sp. NPDC056352 TaxID=3345791 RepID=UPI0035DD5569